MVLVSPDKFVRYAPVGLAFRDASDLSLIGDGLEVRIIDKELPARATMLVGTPSSTWMTHRLPGLNPALAKYPQDPPDDFRAFDVRVRDPFGRFLPARFAAALPTHGRFHWPSWAGFNQSRIRPLLPESPLPPGYVLDYLPLFPAIARGTPGPRLTVRAQLAIRQPDGKDKPASWAAVRVIINNQTIALGVADQGGSVVACGAYPTLPSQTVAEAAAGRSEVTWEVTIRVHHTALAWEPPDTPPDMAAILGQLTTPPRQALANLDPGDPLFPPQILTLGRPLQLASMKTATERFSTLYLKP